MMTDNKLKWLGEKVKPFMPIIGAALGGPMGATVAGALAKKIGAPNSTADTLEQFLNRLSPDEKTQLDRDHAHELAMETLKSDTQISLAQIGLNTQEAKSSSIFVAGWRPFIGWTCGFGILYHFLFMPLANGGIAFATDGELVDIFPPIDIASLSALLVGILGLGTKRTVEKIKGVARKRIRE